MAISAARSRFVLSKTISGDLSFSFMVIFFREEVVELVIIFLSLAISSVNDILVMFGCSVRYCSVFAFTFGNTLNTSFGRFVSL